MIEGSKLLAGDALADAICKKMSWGMTAPNSFGYKLMGKDCKSGSAVITVKPVGTLGGEAILIESTVREEVFSRFGFVNKEVLDAWGIHFISELILRDLQIYFGEYIALSRLPYPYGKQK